MIATPEECEKALAKRKEENDLFAEFLKKKALEAPVTVLMALHEQCARFAAIVDCTTCGKCCACPGIDLTPVDERRLATHFCQTDAVFIDKHLTVTDNGFRFKSVPCVFLDGKKCSVYKARPAVCHRFPYLDLTFLLENVTHLQLDQLWNRAERCPIVSNAVEAMKQDLGA